MIRQEGVGHLDKEIRPPQTISANYQVLFIGIFPHPTLRTIFMLWGRIIHVTHKNIKDKTKDLSNLTYL